MLQRNWDRECLQSPHAIPRITLISGVISLPEVELIIGRSLMSSWIDLIEEKSSFFRRQDRITIAEAAHIQHHQMTDPKDTRILSKDHSNHCHSIQI